MSKFDAEGKRIETDETQGVWTTCDECGSDWWCVVVDRDELDEPVAWACSDECEDEDAEDWDYGPELEYVDCTCGHPNDDHTIAGCPFVGCGCRR